ncbi:MAG: hypothetical protein MUC67_05650 [Acidobacteria bacterium]|jgi:UDP-2,3-diacylglucosamine hydrolase|nr:hypothetical protein [Acidobacteriota bacterium]
MSARPQDVIVVSDLHLVAGDPDLDDFCAFLAARAQDAGTVVLLGDVFAAWLARERLLEPHHRAVLAACAALRGRGVRVVLIEGNREFGAARFTGRSFDAVAEEYDAGPLDGRRWLLAHGDLINADDRAYRRWRALARSAPFQAVFDLLPAAAGRALVRRLERALRGRGAAYRTRLPEAYLTAWAERAAVRGFGGGVLGHFHLELQRRQMVRGAPFELIVMPDWRSTRRALRLSPDAPPRFETWGAARPAAPAIVAVEERAGRARVTLDGAPAARPGARVAFSSGHGPDVRMARLLAQDPSDFRTIELELDPGPALQVGDRLHARPEGSEPR